MALPANWAQSILRGIGAPVTPQNLRFLAAWQRAEGGGTANNANFNPLDTTQPAAGAGSINSVGVRSYRSPSQGIRATVQTLLNGHYGDIVSGLRRNAGAEALAHSGSLATWGTGSGVLRVLGAGGSLSPAKGTGGSPGQQLASRLAGAQAGAGGATGVRNPAALDFLLQEASGQQGGGPTQFLMDLAAARQQAGQPSAQSQNVAAAAQRTGVLPSTMPLTGGHGVKWTGVSLSGLKPDFLHKVGSAVSAIGGTQVRVNSGYRSPAHNRAVGGASDSNHMYGRAMDADVLVHGTWVPLGQALQHVAPKFGLRSGATFDWGGHPDLPHVDDGFNQHH